MPAERIAQSPQVVLILSTFGTAEAAEACGRQLVTDGLAACVQVDGPIRSIYRWRDEVQIDEEFRLLIKTSPAASANCQTTLEQVHPYDLPEIVVLDAAASPAYAAWVAGTTA
jgi:periplasmic divalent cation tolerance protein